MLVRIARSLLALVILSAAARAADEPAKPVADRLDGDAIAAHIEVLASAEYEGRGAGSPGGERAIEYVAKQFEAIGGLKAAAERYRQPFTARKRNLTNVVGLLEGSDEKLAGEIVVVGAHHDHLGKRGDKIFFGADDNASGVAVTIEIAKAMRAEAPTRRSVLFVAFDGEEIGLLGAKHFVAEPPLPKVDGGAKIVAMLNLDMVSRGPADHVCVCGTSESAELKTIVEAAAPAAGIGLDLTHDDEWRHSSDHGPFCDAGIPYLYFGVEDHEDYHKPTDTADKVDRVKLAKIARLVHATLRAVADADSPPGFTPKPTKANKGPKAPNSKEPNPKEKPEQDEKPAKSKDGG